MKTPLALLAAAASVLMAGASAHAAAPSCSRGGAKVLTANGNASVVSLPPVKGKKSSGLDRAYGCWAPTGKRFLLFEYSPSSETHEWAIVEGRYIGLYRDIEEGVTGQLRAETWDARKRTGVHDAAPCNNTPFDPDQDETVYGPSSAVFLTRGAIAYTCPDDSSHVADAKGDRLLEPNGTVVTALAGRGRLLYYTVGGAAKLVEVE